MPRRKKLPAIPDYTGVPFNDDNLVVQKSNPLQTLSETPMTLAELKILDAYLGRINSHDDEKRYVKLDKGELENLLGVNRIRKEDLEKRLKNLFQTVTIRDDTKPKGFKIIALFEEAEAEQDEDGLWQIKLACTQKAMEYIFNIENLGYLRYRLKNVVNLTSRYSYVLYLYLENNRFRKTWEIDIDELRKLLNCTAETYTQFKRFNDLILKKCYNELTKKTTLQYTYTPCRKKGRKYTAIRFTVETLSDTDGGYGVQPDELSVAAAPAQLALDEFANDSSEHYDNENIEFLAGACNNEFSSEEMNEIFALISALTIDDFDTPHHPQGIWFDREQYLYILYHNLNVAARRAEDAGKPIRDRYRYFIAMIQRDIQKRTRSAE